MRYFFIFICIFFIVGCDEDVITETSQMNELHRHASFKELPPSEIDLTAFNREPNEWGEHVTGVKNRFLTDSNEIALTFDLCGGEFGNGYDEVLVDFLIDEGVPATIFVNERWITENEQTFLELAKNPLFQIENHGTAHTPLSVTGNEAWGIPGTSSAEEVFTEIMENHETVKRLTGQKMTLFRSGTAFYDEVAVELANTIGYEVVNFDILGDAGATFSPVEVEQALLKAEAGSIALLHMNQPRSGTAEGVKKAVPQLIDAGVEFVLLNDKEFE